jgi:hypothetical protein
MNQNESNRNKIILPYMAAICTFLKILKYNLTV